MMPNRPEYMALWLGVTRVGGVVALINRQSDRRDAGALHQRGRPKHVIVAAELLERFETARAFISGDAKLWLHGDAAPDHPRIDHAVDAFSGAKLADGETRALTIEDRALYIYTSGTTGLPKAANMNHYRLMLAGHAFAGVMATRQSDRMYDCLPMYHAAGGLWRPARCLVNGGSVVIREKFSAREFWDDIERWNCTIFQYIGEFCRYLVNSPPHPKRDRAPAAAGVRQRLAAGRVGTTSSAASASRTSSSSMRRPKAMSRCSTSRARRAPSAASPVSRSAASHPVVRFDIGPAEADPRRATASASNARPRKPARRSARSSTDASQAGRALRGLCRRKAATEKKILRDVFEQGDAWFRTGDLMRKDRDGYFYFVDRIGDTFRWKGENVSTTEVEETIGQFPGVEEANVYGVSIPGRDGRAGMAALVVNAGFDLTALRKHLASSLPDYARPLFLRIRGEMDVTSTFKQKKIDFVAQGFDPAATTDPIFFDDPAAKAFVRIDRALHDRIRDGGIRL